MISSETVKSRILNEGPKSPWSELAEIDEKLLVERLIEIVGGRDVALDLRRQAARPIERDHRAPAAS